MKCQRPNSCKIQFPQSFQLIFLFFYLKGMIQTYTNGAKLEISISRLEVYYGFPENVTIVQVCIEEDHYCRF